MWGNQDANQQPSILMPFWVFITFIASGYTGYIFGSCHESSLPLDFSNFIHLLHSDWLVASSSKPSWDINHTWLKYAAARAAHLRGVMKWYIVLLATSCQVHNVSKHCLHQSSFPRQELQHFFIPLSSFECAGMGVIPLLALSPLKGQQPFAFPRACRALSWDD